MNSQKATRRDKDKYCVFHVDHGHTTKKCKHLKDEIERLIQERSLKHFVRYNRGNREPSQKGKTSPLKLERSEDEEPIGTVHIILEIQHKTNWEGPFQVTKVVPPGA